MPTAPKHKYEPVHDTSDRSVASISLTAGPVWTGDWVDQGNRKERRKQAKKQKAKHVSP